MACEPKTPIHLPPQEIAEDTYLLRSAQPAFGAPLSVSINSLVILAAEPVVVDTNTRANRTAWLADVRDLVDPAEVRWIFLSHDDEDHTGNLAEMLDLCPKATLVTNWASVERMGGSFSAPPERLRWVDDSQALDVGDRVLQTVRPPVFDSPTTRGLFDPTTGVYWASDAFATPMPSDPVDSVEEIPPPMWAEGFALFHHHALAPWLSMVDREAYRKQVARVRALDPAVIVSAHTPLITGESVDRAIDLIASLPDAAPPPHPDQAALEAALAAASA